MDSLGNHAGLQTMAPAMENAHKYYEWIYSLIRPHLGSKIMEIGPGFGNVAHKIVQDGKYYCAIDQDGAVIDHLRERFHTTADRFMTGEVEGFEHLKEIQARGVDTVLELNVLEHIQDDLAHLSALRRYVPGGKIVLIVPNMKILYGSWDKDAGHFRRYDGKSIADLLKKAGLAVTHMRAFNGLGAVLWFLACRVLRMKISSSSTNASVMIFERVLISFAKFSDPVLSKFFGQSLLVVAQAPR